eukprot:125670-Rhodomonas_salina.2
MTRVKTSLCQYWEPHINFQCLMSGPHKADSKPLHIQSTSRTVGRWYLHKHRLRGKRVIEKV